VIGKPLILKIKRDKNPRCAKSPDFAVILIQRLNTHTPQSLTPSNLRFPDLEDNLTPGGETDLKI